MITDNSEDTIKQLQERPAASQATAKVQRRLAKAYLRAGDLDEAERAIRAAEACGIEGVPLRRLNAALHAKRGQHSMAAGILRRIVAEEKDAGDAATLAKMLINSGDLDEARQIAKSIARAQGREQLAAELHYRIGIAEADPVAVSKALRSLLELCDEPPALPQLAMTLHGLSEPERTELTKLVVQRWPALARKASIGQKRGVQADRTSDAAIILAVEGELAEACEAIRISGTDAEVMDALLERIPGPGDRTRPIIADDGGDVLVSEPGTSGVTLLVFTGLADRTMVPIEGVDAFCAREGHTTICLRDSSRALYVNGVGALADDYEGTIAALRRHLDQCGTRRLLCLGTSAGGFGAIRYALALGAEKVLCASPPTNITEEFLASVGDIRGRLVARRLQTQFGDEQLDLRNEVLASAGKTRIEIWHGARNPVDRAHADYLRGAPAVECHEIQDFEGHATFPRLIATGIFEDFLRDAR